MMKVLIIEDDKFLRGMVGKAMEKTGYEVHEAGNGNEGLDALKDPGGFDIVLTDILMPDKEGLETISEIRGLYPDLLIVAMSGGGATKNMMFLDMAKTIGAQRVIEKPFKPEELFALLDELIGERDR